MKLKLNEYYAFVRWAATPEQIREPETHQEIAQVLGVDNATLSRWKNDPDFYEDVRREIRAWAKDRTPAVIAGLYRKAAKTGDPFAVKLWMDYFERDEVPIEPPKDVTVAEEKEERILTAFANFGLLQAPQEETEVHFIPDEETQVEEKQNEQHATADTTGS